MKTQILYSTDGCHLCEQAWQLIANLRQAAIFEVIDIAKDDQLVAEFGVHIPVIENKEQKLRLYWPFTERQLAEFLEL
ncbi:glutaredoxin family protein [Flocculibacter collagenilyticus]|uniref:glutaredoxin family protein n=1 Tax=Flocculibacter collagenilyticus TaxID=2744479 RepID=UPI0018F7ADB6|nr:glutaredoxin family protein [Flocculibacter collagenilyticus]